MSDRAPKPAPKPPRDVALVHGVTDDGGLSILRLRDDRLEAGVARPMVEGRPLEGEVVRLTPREDAPAVCDVEVLYAPAERGARAGPARVATERYRDGWDAIWGPAPAPPDADLN